MTARLNHIGIAISGESQKQFQKLMKALGLDVAHTEDVPEQGVKTAFLPLPGAAGNLELLDPIDPTGTVARFLAKRGSGVHHLSFEVTRGELEPLWIACANKDFSCFMTPRPGAHAMRVNFVHPASAGGILVEVMEPSS